MTSEQVNIAPFSMCWIKKRNIYWQFISHWSYIVSWDILGNARTSPFHTVAIIINDDLSLTIIRSHNIGVAYIYNRHVVVIVQCDCCPEWSITAFDASDFLFKFSTFNCKENKNDTFSFGDIDNINNSLKSGVIPSSIIKICNQHALAMTYSHCIQNIHRCKNKLCGY